MTEQEKKILSGCVLIGNKEMGKDGYKISLISKEDSCNEFNRQIKDCFGVGEDHT